MFIKSLHLKNILSFKDARLDLQPLNVLIGPNGSGKSNLIDVIALLQAVPGDLPAFFRRNGPTGDWVWKGPGQDETPFHLADVAARFDNPGQPFNYELRIIFQGDRVHSLTERFDLMAGERKDAYAKPFFQASNEQARLWPTRPDGTLADFGHEPITVDVPRGKSVLSEIRNAAEFPALTETARLLSAIKVYRNWYVGRDSPVRSTQRTDGDPNYLEEDFSNLALVVNDLLSRRLEPSLDSYLKRFYESYESLHPRIFGNTIELIVNETGTSSALPASRLSDGSIRFIALLAILCHPEPPPLICIEEPEIAMHPDSLGLIAELLRKASERTQLIVTTHSPELVALFPPEKEAEYVVVCERDAGEGTRFHRPSLAELRDWQDVYQQTGKELVVYGLSEMWLSGAIGGVR